MRQSDPQTLIRFGSLDHKWRGPSLTCGATFLAATHGAASSQMTDPLPETVSRPVARCIARARDGDGAGGKSAGGPKQEVARPPGARDQVRPS